MAQQRVAEWPSHGRAKEARDAAAEHLNEIEFLSRQMLELVETDGRILREEHILLYAKINGLAHQGLRVLTEQGATVRPIYRPLRRLKG